MVWCCTIVTCFGIGNSCVAPVLRFVTEVVEALVLVGVLLMLFCFTLHYGDMLDTDLTDFAAVLL